MSAYVINSSSSDSEECADSHQKDCAVPGTSKCVITPGIQRESKRKRTPPSSSNRQPKRPNLECISKGEDDTYVYTMIDGVPSHMNLKDWNPVYATSNTTQTCENQITPVTVGLTDIREACPSLFEKDVTLKTITPSGNIKITQAEIAQIMQDEEVALQCFKRKLQQRAAESIMTRPGNANVEEDTGNERSTGSVDNSFEECNDLPQISRNSAEQNNSENEEQSGRMRDRVEQIISSEIAAEYPGWSEGQELPNAESLSAKISWWFLMNDGRTVHPAEQQSSKPEVPEQRDNKQNANEKFIPISNTSIVNSSESVLWGSTGKPEKLGDDSFEQPPGAANEFIGAAALGCKLRKKKANDKEQENVSEEFFLTYLKVMTGSMYGDENLVVRCGICEVRLVGSEAVSEHVSSKDHKKEMLRFSRSFIQRK